MQRRNDIQSAPKIIVAADSASGRMLVHGVLSLRGYRVSLAASAVELAELLSSNTYDAVILDLTMPSARGPQYVSNVRAMMESDAQLVVYSVDESQGIEVAVRQAGADHFFRAPIKFTALLDLLEASNSSIEQEALEGT